MCDVLWCFCAYVNIIKLFLNLFSCIFFQLICIGKWKKRLQLVNKYFKRLTQNADNTHYDLPSLQYNMLQNKCTDKSRKPAQSAVMWFAAQHLKPWSLSRQFCAESCCCCFSDWHHWCLHLYWLNVMIKLNTLGRTNLWNIPYETRNWCAMCYKCKLNITWH